MSQPSIILTGFMGTGKSTLGQLLASKIGAEFIDSDELIVEKTGQAISEIFERDGERSFRYLERTFARDYTGRGNLVMSTGGGLMVDPLNAILLGHDNIVFCLTATTEDILARLSADETERPLLASPNPERELERLLEERAEAYSQFIQIDTSNRHPDQIVEEMANTFYQIIESGVWKNTPVSRFDVEYPGGKYPVVVGSGILDSLDEFVKHASASVIVTDDNVAPLYARDLAYLNPLGVIRVAAGEEFKRLDTIRHIYDSLLDCGADRKTTIVSLGGGVVGDMAGFAAATYMRGTPFIQCPTTLLAMVDASVGGKTGVDLPQGKNLVGAFKQPLAVVADIKTLWTLKPTDFRAGMAEIVKHGLIASPDLLERIETTPNILQVYEDARNGETTNVGVLLPIIVEAILIKRDVVQSDPFERSQRKHLNLGHTFAHAIEQVSGYEIPHGQAVAMGLVAAAHLSAHLGHCDAQLQGRIERLLEDLRLPTRIPSEFKSEELLRTMQTDKKRVMGRLNFVLIRGIGDVFVSGEVPEAMVLDTLRALKSQVLQS